MSTTIEPIVDPSDMPPPLPTKEPVVDATPAPTPDPVVDELAAAKAELAAYKAKEAEAASKAEEARLASLTEAQRFQEERKAFDAEKQSLLDDARKAAVDRLGIIPKALPLVPKVDPRTIEGARALESWAKENPEFLKPRITTSDDYIPTKGTPLEDLMSGKKQHPLYTADGIRKLLAK
jgi:hypothetical protein